MANTRDIKRRLASVKSIGHITKAMEMVAGAKLRRAQANVIAARPYTRQLAQLISRLQKSGLEKDDALLAPGTGPGAYIVIAGDRGLSGAYNANILRFAKETLAANPGPILAVGRKAGDHFRKTGHTVIDSYSLQDEEPLYGDAVKIVKPLLTSFTRGEIGSLQLIFTEFVSPLNLVPVPLPLLPIEGLVTEEEPGQYIYEPSPQAVMEKLLPHYVISLVYQGLLEAKASEFAAQRMAMKSATDNANEMIEDLTLSFNRARQTAITQEILEVVNGAQALEG